MDKNIFKGNWNKLKGNVKKQWGKLTDDDLDVIDGNKDILVGKIQEKYGLTVDEAKKQIDEYDWDEK